MEIGSGIFAASLFLGIIALFVATKDRWNWRRIAKWSTAVVIGGPALAVTGLYVWTLYDGRPVPITTYQGVSLADQREDVIFKLGPPSALNDAKSLMTYIGKDPSGKETSYLYISLKDDRVVWVMYWEDIYPPSINGISKGATQEMIEEKLGRPDRISTSADGTRRIISYDSFFCVFELEKNGVVGLGIYAPTNGPPKFAE
jgi:hypothetical protein